MRKIYKFRMLKDFGSHIKADEILEGYYSTFFSYPVVMITATDGQVCGMARDVAEQVELVREVSWFPPAAIPCS